ncbi:30S ribosomal protein S16 [Desulfoplanes sp. PS50]|jgi:small subunit ribosomal protein S16
MAVKIRMTRMGSKRKPFYRIVALDSKTRRDGRPLEFLGYYNPMTEPPEVKLEDERITYWLEQGAIPSDTVRSLLQKKGE